MSARRCDSCGHDTTGGIVHLRLDGQGRLCQSCYRIKREIWEYEVTGVLGDKAMKLAAVSSQETEPAREKDARWATGKQNPSRGATTQES